MKYKIKCIKNNVYYSGTLFKGQYHWTFDKPHIFKEAQDVLDKIIEIVSIKRLTIDDLIIESVK